MKNPIDAAKRIALFAPLGAIALLRDMGPSIVDMLSERGKSEWSTLSKRVPKAAPAPSNDSVE